MLAKFSASVGRVIAVDGAVGTNMTSMGEEGDAGIIIKKRGRQEGGRENPSLEDVLLLLDAEDQLHLRETFSCI